MLDLAGQLCLTLFIMNREDVIRFFGNQARTAKALGITRQAVYRWPDIIPLSAAARVEKVSGGQLKLDLSQYRPKRIPIPLAEQHAA